MDSSSLKSGLGVGRLRIFGFHKIGKCIDQTMLSLPRTAALRDFSCVTIASHQISSGVVLLTHSKQILVSYQKF